MNARCQAFVAERRYAQPGRCEKRHNVQPIKIKKGVERVRLCRAHRAMIEGGRQVQITQ